MNRSDFLLELKTAVSSGEGCTTKTTAEKKEGFVPYNRHGIKWGQVDANGKDYIRIVFDLMPRFLQEAEFAQNTGLSITLPGKITTGYRFKEKDKVDGHDQLIVFLEDSFYASEEQVQAVLHYAREFAGASVFKSHSSR